MGVSVLVLGHSGSGKSTSLRGFDDGEVGIFNVAGKPLPFRGSLKKVDHADYTTIKKTLGANNLNCYVIDDANYLMAFQNFAWAEQKGYDKFTKMSVNFEQLLEAANKTDENTIVYFFMHPEYDDAGRLKPKSIGKMLDNQLNIEGMFPIVLRAFVDDAGYHFATKTDGNDPVKAPMGMFEEPVIDNDLKAVDSVIRAYWEMEQIGTGKAQEDKENEDA